MRMHLLSRNKGHWRRKWVKDSTPMPQSQIGFNLSWKLCLNVCSRKWFGPRHNDLDLDVAPQQIFYTMIFAIVSAIRAWPNKFKNINFKLMNKLKVLLFLSSWSSLFLSIVVDGKKRVFTEARPSINKKNWFYISLYIWWNYLWNYAV